jgi:glucosamine--fructose-6-phosphate aminotransferase (isomerizing)
MRFLYDEQLAAQPDAVAAVLQREVPALDPARPVIFAGLGTSLHACRVAAAWHGSGLARAVDAHELALSLEIQPRDQVVAVSHGGGRFAAAVLAKARAAGALTIAVVGDGAAPPAADHVVRTCPEERAGTHTVSYLTALAALGLLLRSRPLTAALQSVPALLREALALPAPLDAARRLAGRDPVQVTGFGLDAVTASEAALKLKEATYVWAEGTSVELALHGPPAAMRAGMGAVSLTPAQDDGGRTAALRGVLARLSVETVTCGSDGEDLRYPACDPLVRPLVAAVPLQRLAAEIARLTGSSPDTIHRDQEPWKTAMNL